MVVLLVFDFVLGVTKIFPDIHKVNITPCACCTALAIALIFKAHALVTWDV